MNQKLLANPYVYPKVILWWKQGSSETELTLRNLTLKEAYERAILFGYKPPKWYQPWQYLMGGLGVVTIG